MKGSRIVTALFAILLSLPSFSANDSMDVEIDYLLNAVAESNCVFIRNGKEYDGEDARKHLQMKRERGKKYYDSTEEFIERIASKSSWSGKPYRIRCDDAEEDASAWFTALLESFREASAIVESDGQAGY